MAQRKAGIRQTGERQKKLIRDITSDEGFLLAVYALREKCNMDPERMRSLEPKAERHYEATARPFPPDWVHRRWFTYHWWVAKSARRRQQQRRKVQRYAQTLFLGGGLGQDTFGPRREPVFDLMLIDHYLEAGLCFDFEGDEFNGFVELVQRPIDVFF